ncbi:alpha/beta hydrolase-fold protein [Mycoplasmatota bacterium WC44]
MKRILLVHQMKINRGLLNRDVTLRIMLPKSYMDSPKRNYPVLYMMDGQNLYNDFESSYGSSWNFIESFEDETTNIPEIIIIGIDSADGYEILNEYSPWKFTFNGNTYGGKGDDFLKWVTEDLKPWIDSEYRTMAKADYTAIGGSGMGGLISHYALMKYSNTFTRAATISNFYWKVEQDILEYINSEFSNVDKIKYWYTSVGTNETNNPKIFEDASDVVYNLLIKKGLDERKLMYDVIEGGEHNERSWAKIVPVFIKHIYQDFVD